LTDGHCRALARCVTPRTLDAWARDEAMLVDTAARLEADDVEILVTRWLAVNDPDGPDPGGARRSRLHASRTFAARVRVDGDLDADDGAVFLAELERLHQQLYDEDRRADPGDPDTLRCRAERNGAALAEMARRSATLAADADKTAGRPVRPLLTVHVELPAHAETVTDGTACFDDGVPVPAALVERWSCDTALARYLSGPKSIPFDLGAVTYTPTDGQRRALAARDKGCIVGSCRRKPGWCHAHHVIPWPAGPTNLDNLIGR
jgi:hypothetical protein